MPPNATAAAAAAAASSSVKENSNNNNSSIVPPKIICGVTRWKGAISYILLSLTIIYFTFCQLLKDSASYLTPAPEYCPLPENPNCSRSDLASFQIVSGICIFYCAIVGFRCWHVTKRVDKISSTPVARLFGYLEESESLAAINFTFQLWDFFISLLIVEHATAIMLSHHLMAAAISWCSLRYQVLHYYGVFFLGLSEVSSIFLLFIDIAKYFPTSLSSLHFIIGPFFVVTFSYYRIFKWLQVSLLFWSDCLTVLRNGDARLYRPGNAWVIYVFLVGNVPLTVLQVYWFCTGIVPQCREALGI